MPSGRALISQVHGDGCRRVALNGGSEEVAATSLDRAREPSSWGGTEHVGQPIPQRRLDRSRVMSFAE